MSPAPPPIALTGLLRSGKDSVADYLVRQYGYTRFAFGDELKSYAHELFGGDPASKPRELYQWFGQAMRQRDPNIWVRKCFEDIRNYRGVYEIEYAAGFVSNPLRPVITDLRQPNEYERCRAEGYVIIRVTAPEDIRLERARQAGDAFRAEDLAHDTESHVAGFAVDYEIENAETMAELYAKVDAVMAGVAR